MSNAPRLLRRITILFVAPLAILLTLWSATPVGAALLFQLQDLGAPGGTSFSTASAINNNGVIVGSYSTLVGIRTSGNMSFMYNNGTVVNLGALGGTASHAFGINDNNTVVGNIAISGTEHLFTYTNGTTTDLGSLGVTHLLPEAINNSGQIVAYDAATSGHAFLYSNGTVIDLGIGAAYGINNGGQVVGQNAAGDAFLYSNGTMADLGPGGARSINDAGEIVGDNGAGHAYIFSTGSDLGTLGGVTAINASGEIVGYFLTGLGAPNAIHAFLYTGSGPVQDLNSLLAPAPGWTVSYAWGINNSGDIVGQAVNPSGVTVAVLLTPTAIWLQPQSGDWSAQSNWMQSALPGSTIDTNFKTGSATPYTVNLTAASATHNLNVTGDNVTLNLAGNTLTVSATLAITGTLTLAPAASAPPTNAMIVSALNIAGGTTPTGTLNLNNNTLIIQNGGPAARDSVEAQIAYARDNGAWDRPGITSTNAQTAHAATGFDSLTLGDILNSDLATPYTTFAGQPVSPNDVLIKFTYGGDANLNGVVNGDDYFQIDQGFVNHYTGWINGDFNHDGVVNGDDYFIIDSNFINQSGQLAASEVLAHEAKFGPSYLSQFSTAQLAAIGVPEPASLMLLGLGAVGLLARRRNQPLSAATHPRAAP